MDATVEDNLQNVTIPEDDGKLQQALAELDSKLAAWSGAIHHAQSSLKEIALVKGAPAAPEPAIAKIHPIAKPRIEEKVEKIIEEKKEPSIPPAASGVTPVPGEDDEALLATLDPETAKKIQVLRRLTGQNKSVRELIEKHHLTPTPPNPVQTNHKSFWRRQEK